METLFIYLLKSSGLVTLFFLAYYFLLQKETFFTSNRWFLLAGLITSTLLPLLVFTKTILVEPSSATIDWSQIPVGVPVEKTSFEIDWFLTAGFVYALGIAAFLIRFGLDYYSLTKVFKGKTVHQQADFKFIDVEEKLAPFSFFNTIVYNSALYSASELQNIIEHEKVHSEQNHSLDVLLTRLFSILFWFNPVIWLYQKAILQNLEFIADYEALLKISDKKAYQITLLKITAHENCVALSNHFYQSLIKKRIIMLNKNQSNKRNLWKYALVVPALVAFFMLFQVNVVAQEKVEMEKSTTINTTSDKETNKDLNPKESDTVKKTKNITVNAAKKGITDENTEIYVNGKKVSKSEMEELDSSIIKTVDVTKNGKQSTIKIFTKASDNAEDLGLFHKNENQLNSDNIDPTNITGTKKSNKTKIVKVVSKQSEGITIVTDIYIDGIKVDQKELDRLDPSIIERMDVNKPTAGSDIIEITTKKAAEDQIATKKNDGWGITFGTYATEDNIKKIQNDKNVDYKKAIIIINGEISNYQALEKLKPEEIDNMSVEKISTKLENRKTAAIKKYGEKALNGIIEITTKKK
jgi:hypothetical protein